MLKLGGHLNHDHHKHKRDELNVGDSFQLLQYLDLFLFGCH